MVATADLRNKIMVNVHRAGQTYALDEGRFWELVKCGGILPDDLIECQDRQWCRPNEIDGVKDYFPVHPARQTSSVAGELIVSFGAALLVAWGLCKLLEPERRSRRIRPNDEPLPKWLKKEIRERDGNTCWYCGVRVRNGHIDHKNPRSRGGSNRRNNLVLACVPCNLSKNNLTAREFERMWGST